VLVRAYYRKAPPHCQQGRSRPLPGLMRARGGSLLRPSSTHCVGTRAPLPKTGRGVTSKLALHGFLLRGWAAAPRGRQVRRFLSCLKVLSRSCTAPVRRFLQPYPVHRPRHGPLAPGLGSASRLPGAAYALENTRAWKPCPSPVQHLFRSPAVRAAWLPARQNFSCLKVLSRPCPSPVPAASPRQTAAGGALAGTVGAAAHSGAMATHPLL
jgi:hypothetical protein